MKNIRVSNMTSSNGNDVPNQFIIQMGKQTFFQSYNSIIAVKEWGEKTKLDERYWDYSKTTGKYRNEFLRETKRETQTKIDNGTYILTNLND